MGNPSSHPANPGAPLPLLRDNPPSIFPKVSAKSPSALSCGYHKAGLGCRDLLHNRCRCCGHCSLWHAPPLDTAGDRREPPRRGWLSYSKEENVVFRVRKRRVTAANTSFSLHYKNTILEVQSQAFCVLFSRERTLFFTTEYTEFLLSSRAMVLRQSVSLSVTPVTLVTHVF